MNEKTLDRILKQMSQMMPHDTADILLVEGDYVRSVRSRGYDKFGLEDSIGSITYNLADTPNLRVVKDTGQPLAISHVGEYSQWISRPGLDWIKSQVSAPIRVHDQIIGFLNINSSTPGLYGQTDAEQLKAFADYTATAFENARLFDQARHEEVQREQVEQALEETREKIERAKQEWEATIDSLSQLICLLDNQGRVLRANRTVARWGLAQVTDVKGRKIHDLLHPSCQNPQCYLKSFWSQSWKGLVQGQPAKIEADDPILQRHLLVQIHPVSTQLNKKRMTTDSFAVAVFNDFTARRQVEEKLRRSEARNQSLLAAVPDLILQIDKNGVFLDFIPAKGIKLPVSTAELVGKNVTEVFAVKEAQQLIHALAQALHTDETQIFEYQLLVDEKTRYYEVRLVASSSEEALAFVRDISARKRAEEELSNYRNQLEELIAERTTEIVLAYEELQQEINERKEAEEHLRRRNEALTLFNHILVTSATKLGLESTLETACRELAQILGLPQAVAVLLNENQTEATIVAQYLAGEQPAPTSPPTIAVAHDPTLQYLIEHRSALVVNNVQVPGDPDLTPVYELLLKQGTASLLMVPLIKNGSTLGSLSLNSAKPHHFSGEEIELVQFVASQVIETLAPMKE